MEEPSLSTVDIHAGSATLRVVPATGGAIADFTWQGQPVLRPTPASLLGEVRACACYPLVPWSNRIRDGVLHFAGRTHRLTRNFGTHPHAIHGVGWQKPWQVELHTSDTLRLGFEHEAGAAWPWSFAASHTLHLHAHALHATLTIQSRSDEPFPFGLGWHPFFPRDERTRLELSAAAVWRNDATQLPVAHEAIPAQWSFAQARALGDLTIDNVFTGWSGTARLTQPTLGMQVTLEADRACTHVVMYAPPGARFVALEPVTHETDAFNRAAAGAAGTGLRILPPGQAFSCTMRITLEPLQ